MLDDLLAAKLATRPGGRQRSRPGRHEAQKHVMRAAPDPSRGEIATSAGEIAPIE